MGHFLETVIRLEQVIRMAPLPNILTLLRLHRSTNGLTDEELDLIASRASVITFEAATPLHSQENPFIDLEYTLARSHHHRWNEVNSGGLPDTACLDNTGLYRSPLHSAHWRTSRRFGRRFLLRVDRRPMAHRLIRFGHPLDRWSAHR